MRHAGDADRTIKAQLNRIVLIPSVTFLVLFGVLSAGALSEAITLRMAANDSRSGLYAYEAVSEIQEERRVAVEHLGEQSAESLRALRSQIAQTDSAVSEVEDRADGLRGRGRGDGAAVDTARDFLTALDDRSVVREHVVEGHATADEAIAGYKDIVDLGIRAYGSLGRLLGSGEAATASADTVDLMQAQEHFSLADAIASGASASGAMTPGEQQRFGAIMGDSRQRIESAQPTLDGDVALLHTDLVDSPHWTRLHQIAGDVRRSDLDTEDTGTGETPPSLDQWRSVADATNSDLVELADAQAREVTGAADSASGDMLTLAIGGGIIVIFATTVAYGVASRSAGRLTSRLARLRAETLELSNQDLPRLVRRLENGDQVDPDVEVKQLDYGTDEVGQVADAFNTAQRTAVAAAVKQAEVRDGANRVFLGIAHRNQSLVQRQLQVLDRVEREADDPDLLEDLFQLDHLATRGRRNAENLIILGGQQPGRRWRTPIPLVDILRGAISETEEYARVKLRVIPDVSLPGEVVADVLHLLAELVENATAYSPPHTTVHIHGETVAKGLVVEVEDRGLGMSERDLADANRRLGETPEFDVMALNQDARLGLFVVARLAHKHGIQVELCSSPYGGTRAVVLIPAALVSPGIASATTSPRGVRTVGHARTPASRSRPEVSGRPSPALGAAAGTGTRPGAGVVPQGSDGGSAPANGGAPLVSGVAPSGLPKRSPGSSISPYAGAVASGASSGPPSGAPSGRDNDRPPLPRRRRQENLAPQLRDGAARVAEPTEDPERNPDEVRQMFSAFQTGTQRARDTEDGPGWEPNEWPREERTADATAENPRAVWARGEQGEGISNDAQDTRHNGDGNVSGPLTGTPAYTAGAREGYADQSAGDRTGENE